MTVSPADNDAPIAKIREDCKGKSPAERAKYLETSSAIEQAHSTAAQGGQSQVLSLHCSLPSYINRRRRHHRMMRKLISTSHALYKQRSMARLLSSSWMAVVPVRSIVSQICYLD